MSDFARLMEMVLANDPGSIGKLLGEPLPSLQEQMAANEEAVAKANAEQAKAHPPAHQSAPSTAPALHTEHRETREKK
jgi:hypothetical protein